ncbi:hypothetical protein GDO78_023064 [Eleutherodactylus coqui]|uniref:Uncharacterized protein n=1 Tax=Eleutherodactylus coqui TaxID=57060 RepID=A0A8J6E4P7_ELECQ|nr:hypothetical protein GDO78_023064 [Eleutherodactylus coqui]
MVEGVFNLSLEILFQLTGEDYILVKTSSDEMGNHLSSITGLPPPPLIHEDINVQKILELANKIIELLTGELLYQDEDLTDINTTETNVRGDQQCKEEIPTGNRPGE